MAQIIPDGTLGTESSNVIWVDDQTYRIDGGAVRDRNLFHSFEAFSIEAGQGVYFANPIAVENILTRVTGDTQSDINGTLGVLGDANVFLLNPNGVVFGPNAQLDIAGSLHVSTAEAIALGDTAVFSATTPEQSQLLSVSPDTLFLNRLNQTSGDIISRGQLSAGGDLTLAARTLDLQGYMVAGGAVSLLAVDTVQIRDTVETPFMAQAGGNLTIQGNQGIDIWTLQHLEQTPFVSAGDLTLVSDGVISGDAHFESGGNLQFLTLAGTPGNFVSLYDPIIFANGDVVFGDYTGTALKVEATGSIGAEDIVITGPDTTLTADGSGSDEDLLASSRAVILRAGVGAVDTPNLPQATGGTTFTAAPLTTEQPPGSITVRRIITSDTTGGDGGPIILTASGNINTTALDTASRFDAGTAGNGGTITLTAAGDINTTSLETFSRSDTGAAGNGGTVTLTAVGNINTRDVDTRSRSDGGNAGNGGAITLLANGNVTTTGNLNATANSAAGPGDAGNGGAITISASGDIRTADLDSLSRASSGMAGSGGAITLTAVGNILTRRLDSRSRSVAGNSGDGGVVTMTTSAGEVIVDGDVLSHAISRFGNSGDGGAIDIVAAAGDVTIATELDSRSGTSGPDSGNAANGGSISIVAAGNVLVNGNNNNGDALDSGSRSGSGNAGNAGTITLASTLGDIFVGGNLDSLSFSDERDAGNGGAITLLATSGDLFVSGELQSFSFSNTTNEGSRDGGAITFASATGDIFIGGGLNSFSISENGLAGTGGVVTLQAPNGDLQGNNTPGRNTAINTFAIGNTGVTAGRAGDVILAAEMIADMDIVTFSNAGDSGSVRIINRGQTLEIEDLNIITTGQVEVAIPFIESTIPVDLDALSSQSGVTEIESAGDITFKDVEIQANANGSQPAGNISINSPSQITFNNSQINSNANNDGRGGLIAVTAGEGIQLLAGSQLQAQSFAAGQAGGIELTAPAIAVANADISTSTEGTGSAGDIQIETERFRLSNGGQILSPTLGAGRGGTIVINATDAVLLGEGVQDFEPIISVEASGSGRPGDIVISTPRFVLSETASITATATTTAVNVEEGGSITLRADQMDLAGEVSILAETQGQAPGGVLTLQPYQTNPDLNLRLVPGAQVSASTTGSGSGGSLNLLAPDSINISGPGRLEVEARGSGPAGNITVNSQRLTLSEGVILSATASGTGAAGDIIFDVSDRVEINGSIVESITGSDSKESGGDITILDAAEVALQNGGQIAVDSDGQGSGGNVTVIAEQLTLDDNSAITATTLSSDGGDLLFTLGDFLLLRNGSRLSATAGTAQAGGNGGNVIIDVADGFVVSVPNEDSDIVANAFFGDGGNITITAQTIFNLVERPATPNNGTNDIEASSQAGGDAGTINANNLADIPVQEPPILPSALGADAIAQGCQAGSAQAAEFFNTGRGGVASNPGEPLEDESLWIDFRLPDDLSDGASQNDPTANSSAESEPLVEAIAWTRNEAGIVELLAQVAPEGTVGTCHFSQQSERLEEVIE